MSTQILHFIEKNENQDTVDQLISKSIFDSTYISHDTTSIKINSAKWNLTSLRLKDVPTLDGSKENDSYLEQVRNEEGIDIMGSCPNLNDGNSRIYFSNYETPNPKPQEFVVHRSGTCFTTGNEQVYFSPSTKVNDSFPSQMHMVNTIHSKQLRHQRGDSTIQGRLTLTFMKHDFDSLANDCFMVRPKERLSQRFSLTFTQFQPSWCRCMLNVYIKLLRALIVEHTSCKVPLEGGFGLQTEMRERQFYYVNYGSSAYKAPYAEYHSPTFSILDHFNCSLPNLGPTFVSKNCTRSYALKFKVTFGCRNKCTSTFTVATNIIVPVVRSEKFDLKNVREFLFLQKLPLSTLGAQEFRSLVDRKVKSIDGDAQVSHTSATASTKGIFGVVTIVSSRFDPIRCKEDIDVRESTPIDYSEAIVYKEGKYAIHSGDLTIPLTAPKLKPPYDYQRVMGQSLSEHRISGIENHTLKSGESLKDFRVFDREAILRPLLMIRKVSIKIVEATHRVKGQQWYTEFKTHQLLDRRYYKIEWGGYSNLFQRKPLSRDVSRVVIPKLNPTVVTTAVQRHNIMIIELQAGSFFSPEQSIVLSKELLVEGDYDEMIKSTMPPPYKEEFFETTFEEKRSLN